MATTAAEQAALVKAHLELALRLLDAGQPGRVAAELAAAQTLLRPLAGERDRPGP